MKRSILDVSPSDKKIYFPNLKALSSASCKRIAKSKSFSSGLAVALCRCAPARATLLRLIDIKKSREKSLATISKFDKPLEEATTSSLEALQAYTQARRVQSEKGEAEAIPMLKHAVELDPNFALAYVDLGIFYTLQTNLAADNIRKAYELR